jgi:hypothetical protein
MLPHPTDQVERLADVDIHGPGWSWLGFPVVENVHCRPVAMLFVEILPFRDTVLGKR